MTVDPYEQYTDAFGERLRSAAARTGRRRAAGRAALAAVAVVTALVVVVIGLPGGPSLSIVSQARAALGQDHEIVHFTTLVTTPGLHHAPHCTLTWPDEVWTATSGPARWRVAERIPPHPCGGELVHGQLATGDQEFAFADGTQSGFIAAEGVLHRTTGFGARSSASHLLVAAPAANALGNNPITWLRHLLSTAKVQDQGVTTLAGRSVRRLTATTRSPYRVVRIRGGYGVSTVPAKSGPRQMLVTHITYFFDPQSFAPVRFETSAQVEPLLPGQANHGLTILAETGLRVDFSGFERIPLTPATAGLLEIHPPAGTVVRTRSWPELQARRKRYERHH